MKRKFLSVLFALVLVLSFSLVTAVPAVASPDEVLLQTSGDAIAEWSIVQKKFGSYSVHLKTVGALHSGEEGRIVIDPASVGITTLSDITSISWWRYALAGYPAHLDITLDVNKNGVVDLEDVLTAEMAYNNPFWSPETPTLWEDGGHIDDSYGAWFQTFETTEGDGFGAVNNDTLLWVAKMGMGYGTAPSGTLAQWKAGTVGNDPDEEMRTTDISGATPVVKLEIEIDNWVFQAETYVDDVEVNGTTYDLELPTARPLTVDDDRVQNPNAYFQRIQSAIDCAIADEIISVAAGEYAGAVVNEDLTITGAADGGSIITSGVPYKVDSPLLTGFRLDDGADGAEISNFTMNGNYNTTGKFWFAVFARSADSVIVDSLTLDDMVQGITNWGGSGWEITNNVIGDTYPTYGGGIAIYLGADPTDFPHCDNNLVQYNTITTSAVQNGSFTGAAICLWFDERDYLEPDTQSITGNEIKDNSITGTGLENQVGIEIGVGGLDGDNNPDKVAACLGVIHDNTVQDNTIDNVERGLYLYVTTNLTVQGNTVKNCSDSGIYMKDDHANCLINYNDIYGNTNYGLNNIDGVTYSTTVDATKNWWDDPSGPDGPQSFTEGTYTGPLPGTGNKVSAKVQSMPWLTRPFEEVLEDDIAYFGVSFPAQKGWNIVSAPLALDENVTVTVTVDTITTVYTANTWGGLLNLGKKEGDDHALKLHYTEADDGKRTYTPIWYYDSDPDSLDVGWRQANELTEINPVDAFYIRMMESDSFPVLFSPDLSVPSKKLYHGWNLVGCAYMDVMLVEDGQPLVTALATIAEVSSPAGDVKGYAQVVSPPVNQKTWIFIPTPEGGIYIPEGSVGEILMGRGYWVFMENPGTLAGLTFTPISLSGPPAPPPPPGVVTEVSFQWYPVTEGSADYCESSDDDSFTYTLPWTFPFAGKDIVEIEVTSNGLIELLESGETSDVTDSFDYMIALAGDYPDSDIIFAWNDDLDSGSYGFYGVEYDSDNDVVVVHWETETNDDEYETEFIPELNYFQLCLFPDGSIKWNFKEFNYVLYGYDLGTGIYDSTSQTFFNVAHAMGEPDGIFNTPEKSYEISGEYMP